METKRMASAFLDDKQNSIKAGAHASIKALWSLSVYARAIAFLLVVYLALFPFYQYHYTTQGFHYFPLTQAIFLVFKYVADIQTALQLSSTEYTFFSANTVSHFLWVPLILFLSYYAQILVIAYMQQITRDLDSASFERSFIALAPKTSIIAYWSIISSVLLLPLGILWSFSQQETLLVEFVFADSAAAGWFFTSKLFRFLLLFILFLHQWVSYALLPAIALEADTLGSALIAMWHQLRRYSQYYLGATLGFSVMWGVASWACKPFLTGYPIPISIQAVTLLFAMSSYFRSFSEEKQKL